MVLYKKVLRKSLFLLLPLLQFADCSSSDKSFSEREWKQRIESERRETLFSSHIRNNRFFNPWIKEEKRSFLTLLKWRFSGSGNYNEFEAGYLPAYIKDAKGKIRAAAGKDFIVWIGHSTFFMRVNGEYWLTDPIFSKRALLPKRLIRPGLSIDDVKELADKINVIITHNHYDHFDEDSIRNLPDNTKFFVPLGLKKNINKWNKGQVFERDWWQSVETDNHSTLVCLPSQHWSNRLGEDVNEALWASFLLITPSVKIYFGCDSGYFIGFKEIGEKFKGIDYAVLSTGAYMPRWFMHYMHMDMEEAINAFHDLGAKYFIPCHWGTFNLGEEPPGYPSLDLRKRIKEMELEQSEFKIMNIGEILLM